MELIRAVMEMNDLKSKMVRAGTFPDLIHKYYKPEDVKEFIRQRDKLDFKFWAKEMEWKEYVKKRNKLSGFGDTQSPSQEKAE